MKRAWLWLAWAVLAVNGTAWAMTAEDVVRKTGVAGGLCSFPRLTQADEPVDLLVVSNLHYSFESDRLGRSVKVRL